MINNQELALWEEKKAIRAIYGTEKQRIPGASAHKPITHAQKDTHVSVSCRMSVNRSLLKLLVAFNEYKQ